MSSKKGLGSNACQPAYLITPCPAVVDQYFTEQMHYCKLAAKAGSDTFVVTYSKTLSHKDHPMFECLAGDQYISYITVDIYNGVVLSHYFEVRDKNMWKYGFTTYNECPEKPEVEWLFKWHLNIVHMTREYLKGGWLYRSKRQKELEVTKDKYVILNKKGFTNILENAKPDNVEFLGNGKVK
jgi:hypothetical protein